jgi:radical SAM protein with 4Fe4S-binding SPASM domain
MCPRTYSKEPTGFMDFRLFRRIIDEIDSFALETKLLMGGESLLHPNIVEMVRYAHQSYLLTEIDTNATRLTWSMAADLINSGLDYLSVSFDGYDKSTYEDIRRGAIFERTVQKVIDFLATRRSFGSRKPFVKIKSIVVPGDERFSEKKRRTFMELFACCPPDEFAVIKSMNWANEDVEKNEALAAPPIEHRDATTDPRFHPCQRLYCTLTILWDGRVVPCCKDFDGELVLGNVQKDSVRSIWNGSTMRVLRGKHKARSISDLNLCSSCTIPYTKTVMGVPVYFLGGSAYLKKRLGYRLYRMFYNLWRKERVG